MGPVSKSDAFYVKNEEFCIKNEELCLKNEEICIQNDEFYRAQRLPSSRTPLSLLKAKRAAA